MRFMTVLPSSPGCGRRDSNPRDGQGRRRLSTAKLVHPSTQPPPHRIQIDHRLARRWVSLRSTHSTGYAARNALRTTFGDAAATVTNAFPAPLRSRRPSPHPFRAPTATPSTPPTPARPPPPLPPPSP